MSWVRGVWWLAALVPGVASAAEVPELQPAVFASAVVVPAPPMVDPAPSDVDRRRRTAGGAATLTGGLVLGVGVGYHGANNASNNWGVWGLAPIGAGLLGAGALQATQRYDGAQGMALLSGISWGTAAGGFAAYSFGDGLESRGGLHLGFMALGTAAGLYGASRDVRGADVWEINLAGYTFGVLGNAAVMHRYRNDSMLLVPGSRAGTLSAAGGLALALALHRRWELRPAHVLIASSAGAGSAVLVGVLRLGFDNDQGMSNILLASHGVFAGTLVLLQVLPTRDTRALRQRPPAILLPAVGPNGEPGLRVQISGW